MEDILGESFARTQALMSIILVLALLVLALTVGGIYGVLSKLAAQQRGQIALRMALGAKGGDVRFWLVRKSLYGILFGIVIGVLSSFPVANLFTEQLHGVATDHLGARMIAMFLVLGMAAFATLVPAARASRFPPAEALKNY